MTDDPLTRSAAGATRRCLPGGASPSRFTGGDYSCRRSPRQHRRRRVGVATVAAAVGVGGATVVWLSRPANPRADTVDRPTTPTSGPTPATEGPVAAGITLTTVEPA